MPINFNVAPYYDDFDASKNYHRILFKPNVAVQARELTQAQTILQNQITSFADNIFKQNSPVTGGQVTTNFNCYYIKLQSTYNGVNIDVSKFLGLTVTDTTGAVIAKVIAVADAIGTGIESEPPTLIISYKSGAQFADNNVIYDVNSNLAAQAIATNSQGTSSVASISQGVFYIASSYTDPTTGLSVSNGIFSQVSPSTVILSKYSSTPSVRIGLTITETIHDYIDDSSLLDPAIGASNYQAPGADRYVLSITLDTRPLTFGDDQNFIELVRVDTGNVYKMVDGSVYATIEDYFAKRDYETNGDYVVNDFKLIPKITDTTIDPQANTYTMNVGKGLAYVRGRRVENPAPVNITSNRSRTTANVINNPIYTGYGSYLYISGVEGTANGFFDVTTEQQLDLHCVPTANISFASQALYNSTLVSTGYTRGFAYDHSTTDANPSSFVYRLYVNDLQNSVATGNAVSSTSSTITLPSTFSTVTNAYSGVIISITNGTDMGDFRTITSYNGATKVATVSSTWSVNPDTTSQFALNFGVKDIEGVMGISKTSNNIPSTIYSTAQIDPTGKSNGLSTGQTILENPTTPELIFNVGNPYVQTISSGSYITTHEIRNVQFNSSSGTTQGVVAYTGSYSGIIRHIVGVTTQMHDSDVRANYTIIVTNKGSNSSINVGDVIPWTSVANPNRSVAISSSSSLSPADTATFSTVASDLSTFTATIIAKVYVEQAVDTTGVIKKKKTLVLANTSVINTSGTQINNYTFVDDSTNSTGQVYIQKAGIVAPGTKQSLYLSDVATIAKIIDTGSPSVTPTLPLSQYTDITSNFIFDNGQRDNYYDHASITLAPGAPVPSGNILVFVNYFKHSGGDGYFDVDSYQKTINGLDFYRQISTYTSTHGTIYSLRDSIDFRPARLNAPSGYSTSVPPFALRYSTVGTSSTYGVLLPTDGGIFNSNYFYYLARRDLLVITKDRNIQIIEGAPAINPIYPNVPDGSLVLAQITHNPYTGYLPTEVQNQPSDLSIVKVQHKRYTMADIASLDTRIGQVEYYTSLSALEQSATGMQISDAFGLNRFKNGIMTDDFSSYATADTSNPDYSATINKRTRQMTAPQIVSNFPLKNLALAYNLNSPSQSLLNSLNYAISTDGQVNYFTLPYTSALLTSQKIASRITNTNPFSVSSSQGTVALTPNVDNWVDNTNSPSLLITDPNLQVFQPSAGINVLTVGDWQTISGTTVLSGSSTSVSTAVVGSSTTTSTNQTLTGGVYAGGSTTQNFINHQKGVNWGFGPYIGKSVTSTDYYQNVNTATTTTTATTTATTATTTDTYTTTLQQQQNNVLGPYTNIGNTYAQSNGYITDISMAAWMRPQEIIINTSGLLFNSTLYNFFDNVSVDTVVLKPNIIELTNISASTYTDPVTNTTKTRSFQIGDVVGYLTSGTFYPTGIILDTYQYPNSSNMRLYVSGDAGTTSATGYNNSGTLYDATFNSDGTHQIVASATLSSTNHFGGSLQGANTTISTVQLSTLASSTDNYYTGNTLNIVSGTGFGTQATITSYVGATRTATLSYPLNGAAGSVYSIGTFKSNEQGNYCAIFCVPPQAFHNGQRTFRVDNRINNDITTVTTFGEGTFYSEGLQTTAQQIDFGASPAGAKGTFIQTNNQTVSYATTSTHSSTTYSTDVSQTTTNQVSAQFVNTQVTQSPYDPVAQTFIIDPTNFPNGAYLNSLQLFFSSIATDGSPVHLSIVGTLNGYPNGQTLDHSMVTLYPPQCKVSQTPQYLDATTYTEFDFPVPVYIQPGVLYAFIVKSNSNEYNLWTASNGDTALPSSVKNLPTDPTPTNITKITTAPYVGGLFLSQNSQTWTADQNQSLMFNLNRCVFDTTKNPTVRMVVPQKLPGRTIIQQSINYYNNANNVTSSNTVSSITNNDVLVDAFNITTTDFVPTGTGISYAYSATLPGGVPTSPVSINPGKYGTSMYDNIYLNDNLGERVLQANSQTSFSMYAFMGSTDDTVSPVISDAGTSLYAVQFAINNCQLSNNLITLVNGGANYNANATHVTVSAPTGKNGNTASAIANVVNGVIQSVYFTYGGSGYITTPVITITDNSGSGVNVSSNVVSTNANAAIITIAGETSVHGGPGVCKYMTKKVVLDAGFDSGDLNVYMTAYRPVNTDILVYYKLLSRQDTQKFESGSWQLMTKTNSSDTLYSQSRSDLFEFSFAPGTNGSDQGFVNYTSTNGQTYTTFSQFAIKVVLVTNDKTNVPFLSDLRAIALPANVNSSV